METSQVRRAGWLATLVLALAGCAGDSPTPAKATSVGQLIARADLAVVGQVADPAALEEIGLVLDPLPEDAALVGSHYAIVLAGVAVAAELTYDQLRALNLRDRFPEAETRPLRAGPGREFLVVHITQPESTGVVGGDSAEVIVDGDTIPLESVPHADEALVVSVPVDGDAVLAITDASDTKSINIRTGEREGGVDRPAETLVGGGVDLEEGIAIAGVTPPGRYDELTVRVSLEATSHRDDRGWAPDGSMWLEVDFQLNYLGIIAEGAQLRLDLAESLAIQGSDGTTVEIPADTELDAALDEGTLTFAVIDWSGAAEVPDDLRAFEVSYATHGAFVTAGGDELSISRYEVTPSGTIELTER